MSNTESRLHRKERIRKKVTGSTERPRFTIYKSARHMHAQIIDDSTGKTLAAASTLSKELKGKLEGDKKEAAKKVGALLAEKAKAAKVEKVVFDRNGFPYHGRVAAIADGAREGGLQF